MCVVDSCGKLNDWADFKTNILSSAAGDNGADSVFSEPMGLNLNHDSGPANPNGLFGDTKDSGVGRSPRAPGSGSDPRSLGESSLPPAWLQDVSVFSIMYFWKGLFEALIWLLLYIWSCVCYVESFLQIDESFSFVTTPSLFFYLIFTLKLVGSLYSTLIRHCIVVIFCNAIILTYVDLKFLYQLSLKSPL